jgi:N-acetylneuraminic acid mutarotase
LQAQFKTLGDVYRLGAGDAAWTRVAQLPKARNYARAVVYRDAVYVVGGSRTPGDSHGSYGSRLVDRFTG